MTNTHSRSQADAQSARGRPATPLIELEAELQWLAVKLGRVPRPVDVNRYCDFVAGTYYARYDTDTWDDVLVGANVAADPDEGRCGALTTHGTACPFREPCPHHGAHRVRAGENA